MTNNIGGLDRALRVVIGLALILFALLGPADTAWKWIGFIGFVPLVTGLVGSCPLYSLLGITTKPLRLRQH